MKNTLENKAKFFALYWSIEETGSDNYTNIMPDTWNEFPSFIGDQYLILKPLSSIGDKDLEYIRPLVGYSPDGIGLVKRFLTTLWSESGEVSHFAIADTKRTLSVLIIVDYLRSRGYAIPWRGLSVEKQIEYGWIKLKSEK